MDLFNFCYQNKYVRFNKIVQVILIPSIRDEYIQKNKDSIWYNDESYAIFIQNERDRLRLENIYCYEFNILNKNQQNIK